LNGLDSQKGLFGGSDRPFVGQRQKTVAEGKELCYSIWRSGPTAGGNNIH